MQSSLNQEEYGIAVKRFGNWRAQFKSKTKVSKLIGVAGLSIWLAICLTKKQGAVPPGYIPSSRAMLEGRHTIRQTFGGRGAALFAWKQQMSPPLDSC